MSDCRIAPVWTDLTVTYTDDMCSLKWSGSCLSPDWLPMLGSENETEAGKYCYTVDQDGVMRSEACNQTRGFICEIETGQNFNSLFNQVHDHCVIEQ